METLLWYWVELRGHVSRSDPGGVYIQGGITSRVGSHPGPGWVHIPVRSKGGFTSRSGPGGLTSRWFHIPVRSRVGSHPGPIQLGVHIPVRSRVGSHPGGFTPRSDPGGFTSRVGLHPRPVQGGVHIPVRSRWVHIQGGFHIPV